jgi:hypothetical protein
MATFDLYVALFDIKNTIAIENLRMYEKYAYVSIRSLIPSDVS